jgi:hypothetical protein
VIQTFFLVFTMVLGQFNLFSWHGKKPYRRSQSNEAAAIDDRLRENFFPLPIPIYG